MQGTERRKSDLSTTQMLKGILDGCLLAIIKNKEVYGYELAEKLESYGFRDFSEGTIYPLLMRMQKQELLYSTLRKSTDRKSTRLNSSHVAISYAVFCLKKKK